MSRYFTINHIVALLALVLSIASYLVMRRYHFPDKVCVGGAILAILVVGIFWSCVLLGTEEDEDEE